MWVIAKRIYSHNSKIDIVVLYQIQNIVTWETIQNKAVLLNKLVTE